MSKHQYFRCPYCPEVEGGHGVKVPRTTGLYRIKHAPGGAFIILKCQRKGHTFKLRMMGSPLGPPDMLPDERIAFDADPVEE